MVKAPAVKLRGERVDQMGSASSFNAGAGVVTKVEATSRAVSCLAQGQFGSWERSEPECCFLAQQLAISSCWGAVMQHQHIGRPMQRVRIKAVRRESIRYQMI